MKPQALVLGFGGVISRMLFESHRLTEAALGLAPGTLRWRGPFDPAQHLLWRDMQTVIWPEAVAAIQAAQATGIKRAVLSNELALFYGSGFRQRLPLLVRFEVVVDSTHIGTLKPDPRAYQACAAELGLPAGACVFVDDQWSNVLGGQRAGLQTVHFDVMNPRASCDKALYVLGLARTAQPGSAARR